MLRDTNNDGSHLSWVQMSISVPCFQSWYQSPLKHSSLKLFYQEGHKKRMWLGKFRVCGCDGYIWQFLLEMVQAIAPSGVDVMPPPPTLWLVLPTNWIIVFRSHSLSVTFISMLDPSAASVGCHVCSAAIEVVLVRFVNGPYRSWWLEWNRTAAWILLLRGWDNIQFYIRWVDQRLQNE